MAIREGTFTTGDDVRLHYLEAGQGPALVMLPAWTAPAAGFAPIMEILSDAFHCIAFDPRGHGESGKPTHGYRIGRMAMDVRELMAHLDLERVAFFGHSAGCTVLWRYFDLFGEANVRSWVFCDQMTCRVRRPEWSDEETAHHGAEALPAEVYEQALAIGGPDGEAIASGFLKTMFTAHYPAAARDAFIAQTLKMPRQAAANYLVSVSFSDNRDVLPRLTRPTLCLTGEASHLAKAMPWMAKQIPGAHLAILPASEGGSHFMVLENPAWVAAQVRSFLAAKKCSS